MLSKTDLCALEPEYNTKGQRSVALLLWQMKEFVAGCDLQAPTLEEGAGGFIGKYRNCVCAASFWTRFLKQKAKKGGGKYEKGSDEVLG